MRKLNQIITHADRDLALAGAAFPMPRNYPAAALALSVAAAARGIADAATLYASNKSSEDRANIMLSLAAQMKRLKDDWQAHMQQHDAEMMLADRIANRFTSNPAGS